MATVSLRRAGVDDADLLWEIRSDPDVRRHSWNTGAVEHAEHIDWLRHKLGDADSRLYVVVAHGKDVGQVRIDRRTDTEAEISIDLLPRRRGRGIGREAIRLGRQAAADELGVEVLVAEIKEGNVASQAAFAAAGFAERARTEMLVEMQSRL
jgi:RimJ/RimL family protein N-acetyltransferase